MSKHDADKCTGPWNGDNTLSPTTMRIVKLLVGRPPVPVCHLIGETGVSRTAIVEQLNELIACGFAERYVEPLPGRGRPRYVYAATPAALPLLSSSLQKFFTSAIWRAIREIGGQELVREIAEGSAVEMARHYLSRITSKMTEDRVLQMARVLQESGCIADIDHAAHGLLVLRNRSCPFISVLDEDRSICRVCSLMMTELCGHRIRQVASRLDGAPCCVFEIRLQAYAT